jgi:hypothetical protein
MEAFWKIHHTHEKLDTIARVRAGFSKRPSGVGVVLASNGNIRRRILDVL